MILKNLPFISLLLLFAVAMTDGTWQRLRRPGATAVATRKMGGRGATAVASRKMGRLYSLVSGKQREYIEQVMSQYGTPETISRIVRRDAKSKKLYSPDHSMQQILDFATQRLPEEMAKLELPSAGCYLSFAIGKGTNSRAFLFDIGTMVQEDAVEHYEIFEERKTGRKMMLKKGEAEGKEGEGKRKIRKKGELMGTNGMPMAKGDGEGGNGDEEEEDEDEEKEVIKLGTYAILRAIQLGERGFGTNAVLDYSNLPEDEAVKHATLRTLVLEFFDELIAACDGKIDGVAEDDDSINVPDNYGQSQFNLLEMMERIKAKDGKMESNEDLGEFEKEVHWMMAKMVATVRGASDKERAEIRELTEQRKKEFSERSYSDRRASLVDVKENAYNFLKTVQFGIDARPAHKEFKKLTKEQFDELTVLANKTDLSAELATLSDVHRSLADTLIHAKRPWITKAAISTRDAAKSLGEMVGNKLVALGKWTGLVKSREETSGEQAEKAKKAAAALEAANAKRRAALADAVAKMKAAENAKCSALKNVVKSAVYGDLNDPALQDLHARLGAQALNSVINTKRFPEGHSTAVAMSVGGSGVIGIFLDVLIVPLMVLGMTGIAGPIPFLGIALITVIKYVIKPMLESSTPLVAETFDSAIIKQYLDSLKGQKFWRGIKHFRKTLIEASESGKIAAVGSIFYNFSLLSSSPFMLPLQFVFNVIAAVTSAAQVPIELMKTRDGIMKAIYLKQKANFFPPADDHFKGELAQQMKKAIKESSEKFWGKMFSKGMKKRTHDEEMNMAYMDWLERETWRSMEVEQSSRLAINSMGVGPIVSSIVFIIMQIFQRLVPSSPEALINAVSVMFNSPTEMISLTGAIFGANNIGIEKCPWLLSTDEQKNVQLMGLIFEKSRKQLEANAGGGHFVPITNEEMHKIYNPMLATMPLGRFFVNGSIFMKEKWDKFRSRNEHKMKALSGGKKGGKNDLLVEHNKDDMVYLITLPRTSTAQSLSPKALALESWLVSRKIPFYRISDGLFMRKLFTESVPYIEYNGKKLEGTTAQIIQELLKSSGRHPEITAESKKFEENYIKPIESVLKSVRNHGGMDFIINDKGLTVEMISTMSQLYPKLVDYEADYVESWDTLPWQLKRTYAAILSDSGDQIAKGKQIAGKKETISTHQFVEKMNEIIEILKGSNHLFHNKPTYLDDVLFGLLVQFFETPLHDKDIEHYFEPIIKNPEHVLSKFYQKKIMEMGGKNWIELKESWRMNYDFKPEHYNLRTETGIQKYKGQFVFDLELADSSNPKAIGNREHEQKIKTFAEVAKIDGEPMVDNGQIEAEMRAEKVPHEWFSFVKVKKQWKEEEFARVLEERIEAKKRELYHGDIEEKLLKYYPPVMTAIVDKLLDIVWESSKTLPGLELVEQPPPNSDIEKSEQQLSAKLSEIMQKYMDEASKSVLREANNRAFRAFVYGDKAGELYAKRTKDAVLNLIERFYDAIFTRKAIALMENSQEHKKIAGKVFAGLKSVTIQNVLGRVNYIFDREINEVWLEPALKKIEQINMEALVENALKGMKGKEKEGGQENCVDQVLAMQRDARAYIGQNGGRIGRQKSKRALIDRLNRLFDRYINMEKVLREKCRRSAEVMAKIKAIDAKTWHQGQKEMAEEKAALKRGLAELEARRKERVKEVNGAYLANEKMRELVREKIGQIDVAQAKGLVAKLGEEQMQKHRRAVGKTLHELDMAQRTDLTKEVYAKQIAHIDDILVDIIGRQNEIIPRIGEPYRNEQAKNEMEAKMKAIEGKYRQIEGIIAAEIQPAIIRERVKAALLGEIQQLRGYIVRIGKCAGKNMKQTILDTLTTEIDVPLIKERLEEKVALVWKKQLTTEEAEARLAEVREHLVAEIRRDAESEAQTHGLEAINEKMAQIGAEHKQADAPEETEIRGKMVEIRDGEAKMFIEKEFAEFHSQQYDGLIGERKKQIKYPLAKVLLHIAAAYLCEGDKCGDEHKLLASNELKKSIHIKIDLPKLMDVVNMMVHSSITDFNENFLIREAILKQYGLPLRDEIEKEENESDFWDGKKWMEAVGGQEAASSSGHSQEIAAVGA